MSDLNVMNIIRDIKNTFFIGFRPKILLIFKNLSLAYQGVFDMYVVDLMEINRVVLFLVLHTNTHTYSQFKKELYGPLNGYFL